MNESRKQTALSVRIAAAKLAESRPHPRHIANGDEQKFRDKKGNPNYLASFTKGMPHDYTSGLICNADDFQQFVKGIDSGDPRDFIDTPLGPKDKTENGEPIWCSTKAKENPPKVRAWESQAAGNTFDLEGPDAFSVTMPPAPAIGSDELTAEMAEVYLQALLRDVPFADIVSGTGKLTHACHKTEQASNHSDSEKYTEEKTSDCTVKSVIDKLNDLNWFSNQDCCQLSQEEQSRKRGVQNLQTAFRGITPGDDIGPYISQFLLAGDKGVDGSRKTFDGKISYGAIRIDQRVRYAQPCADHMTVWNEWFDVQNGADFRAREAYQKEPKYRFITSPRDLSTYVHYDALYEAYLNACLLLLSMKMPFDPGIPFQQKDAIDHQQGFAQFGGPHILSLVTEVATRALKAVRVQKFNVHRRLRPEALAARLSKHTLLDQPELTKMATDLASILALVEQSNPTDDNLPNGNYLLPMAFCEGSPMHPSYGAGHATVAGACVTILKAFFDHKHPLAVVEPESKDKANMPEMDPSKAYVAITDSAGKSKLKSVDVVDANDQPAILTVEGELNKLASNISIGRDWAGVHYFSDYIESLRMGEQIAIGILEEQKLTYGENFSMTVPLFDGGSIRI